MDEELKEPGLPCEEYHCAGRATEHNYGDAVCDWALDAEGSVIGKSEG